MTPFFWFLEGTLHPSDRPVVSAAHLRSNAYFFRLSFSKPYFRSHFGVKIYVVYQNQFQFCSKTFTKKPETGKKWSLNFTSILLQ